MDVTSNWLRWSSRSWMVAVFGQPVPCPPVYIRIELGHTHIRFLLRLFLENLTNTSSTSVISSCLDMIGLVGLAEGLHIKVLVYHRSSDPVIDGPQTVQIMAAVDRGFVTETFYQSSWNDSFA